MSIHISDVRYNPDSLYDYIMFQDDVEDYSEIGELGRPVSRRLTRSVSVDVSGSQVISTSSVLTQY